MSKAYIESGRSNQKQKTRNVILNSAKQLLGSGKDFSLDDIADHAHLSRATVYRYFSNVDVLSLEAGLDYHTKSPEDVFETLKDLPTLEALEGIQDYYNNLALKNEAAFRRYLSVVISPAIKKSKRGARRNQTLDLALKSNDLNLTKSQKDNLIVVLTTLMGIEAMIVTKDVCRLDNKRSKETLQWGLKMLLRGVQSSSE